MKIDHDKLQLRQTGKGFVINYSEGLMGRMLTQTFVDQYKKTYIKINGEITPLTDQHNFLAVD